MTKERYVEVYSEGSQEHANWENSVRDKCPEKATES
jgi:hypothetical protein